MIVRPVLDSFLQMCPRSHSNRAKLLARPTRKHLVCCAVFSNELTGVGRCRPRHVLSVASSANKTRPEEQQQGHQSKNFFSLFLSFRVSHF